MSQLVRKDLLPGLYITFSQLDGTWLHFESKERQGAFCLEVYAEQGYIAGQAVAEWCAEYRGTLQGLPAPEGKVD